MQSDRFVVFVYGTLMRGERAHSFLNGARFLGEYTLADYALYNLGWYPGIRQKAGSRVFGEAYEVDAAMLKEMDRYEGEASLYHRTPVHVQNDDCVIDALAYVYAREISDRLIESGSWKKR